MLALLHDRRKGTEKSAPKPCITSQFPSGYEPATMFAERGLLLLESGIVFISIYVCSLCTWYVILQYNVNLADAYTSNGL